jgi:hypothetical protein
VKWLQLSTWDHHSNPSLLRQELFQTILWDSDRRRKSRGFSSLPWANHVHSNPSLLRQETCSLYTVLGIVIGAWT